MMYWIYKKRSLASSFFHGYFSYFNERKVIKMDKKQKRIMNKHLRFFNIRQMEIKFWCFLEEYSHNRTEKLRDKQMEKICKAMKKAGFDSDDWNTVKKVLDSLEM